MCLRCVVSSGIRRAHLLLERGDQRVEKRLALAEHEAVANRAAHDPAQHVAAAFVRGLHAVGDQERRGANVIGDHLAANSACRSRVRVAFAAACDQVPEQVDVVVAVHALHDSRDALEAHAGVDRRFRQRRHRAVGRAVELHENEIPDLDVAVAVFVR